MRLLRTAFALLLVGSVLVSCSHYVEVGRPYGPVVREREFDHYTWLKVRTVGGREWEIVAPSVENGVLAGRELREGEVGGAVSIPLPEIERLWMRERAEGRTYAAVVLVPVALITLALLMQPST